MSIDLHTLSGAYALDALSAEEATLFVRHLEQCQACRDEVRELREAAATMGAVSATEPPAELKSRVLAAASRQPQLPPKVTPIEHARSRRWIPRLAGAAAAVILAVTGTVVAVNQLREPNEPTVAGGSVEQVFKAPDAHTVTVRTANGGRLRVATSAEFGQMALATKGLPELKGRSYQMWAIRNERPTSVGVIENLQAGKVMPMPTAGTTVAITIEPAGGSERPTGRPIISMDPEEV